MSARIYLSHISDDLELANDVVELLESSLGLDDGLIACTGVPGYPSGAALAAEAEVFIALISSQSVSSFSLAFETGVAWGAGKRLVGLLAADLDPTVLPKEMADVSTAQLGAEGPLLALLAELAEHLQVSLKPSEEVMTIAGSLAPGAGSAAPAAGDPPPRPPPPVPAPEPAASPAGPPRTEMLRTSLSPPRSAAFEAGRAMSEFLLNESESGLAVRELGHIFGSFVQAIGGDWEAIHKLGDPVLWSETANNLLAGLDAARGELADWYDLGYRLAAVLHAALNGDGQGATASDDLEWNVSLDRLGQVAQRAGVNAAAVGQIEDMLRNLAGPEPDYTHVARALEAMRAEVARADQR